MLFSDTNTKSNTKRIGIFLISDPQMKLIEFLPLLRIYEFMKKKNGRNLMLVVYIYMLMELYLQW